MNSIYERALEKWGTDAQVTQTMGECGELVAALNRFFFQGRAKRGGLSDVINEMADVKIMIRQMELLVGKERVRSRVVDKLRIIEGKLKGGD